jgi:hypothetical protein
MKGFLYGDMAVRGSSCRQRLNYLNLPFAGIPAPQKSRHLLLLSERDIGQRPQYSYLKRSLLIA